MVPPEQISFGYRALVGSVLTVESQLWAQIEARSRRRGVIRSSLQPEETAGLTRSGDLSRMLPFETHLLAAGWPRDSGPDGALGAGQACYLALFVKRMVLHHGNRYSSRLSTWKIRVV
jgi:hypothetical protein